MPPKVKPNAFYMYMLAEQKKIRSLSNRTYSMKDMPAMCRDSWKRLTKEEKATYEALAKREKEKLQNLGEGAWAKLDCHRQVIAHRKDPVKEANKRRTQERQALQNSWADEDSRDILFHILDFQVMYDDRLLDHHFPLEIGMVSFTLRKGVINYMHRFINPGDAPQGNRHLAVSHSENSHKIPLNFEHADANFKALVRHMTDFLRTDSPSGDIPPVFCLSVHRDLIENCLDFIYSKVFSDDMNKIERVYCLEDLVMCLISNSGKVERSVAESQVYDVLIQNKWDYNSSIRCFYHEELDCSFCSLSIVRRYSFAIFDILSKLLEFRLTVKHLPEELEQAYTVTESIGFGRQAYNRQDDQRDRIYKPPPARRGNPWQPPKVEPVQVVLSDEESEEEEEEPPKPQEFSYKKLRLPKSLAQVQTQVGQMSLQPAMGGGNDATPPTVHAYSNPTPAPPAGMNNMAVRPMGRGSAPRMRGQPRPEGRGVAPPPGFVGPPPGFGPGISRVPGAPTFPAPATGPDEEHFPALSRGRGRGMFTSN